MERRTLIFIVLSLGIWYAWMSLFGPEPVEEPTDVPVVEPMANPSQGSVAPAPVPTTPDAPVSRSTLEHCEAIAQWSSQGGALSKIELPAYKAPYQVTPIYNWALGGFGAWSPYGDEPGPATIFSADGRGFTIGAGDVTSPPAALVGSPTGASGTTGPLRVEQAYRMIPAVTGEQPAPCLLEVTYRWTNTSGSRFDGPLWVGVHDALPDAGGMLDRYSSQSVAMASIDEGIYTFTGYGDLDGPYTNEGSTDWFGVGDRYFAAYALPATPHGAVVQNRREENGEILDGISWIAREGLDAGATHEEVLRMYIGNKDIDIMGQVTPQLANSVELGWFGFFGWPLLLLLRFYQGYIQNWGISIILLTVTIKIAFFPLTQAAFRSGQAMQALQPELKEMRETYKDDPQELNRRTMELFRERGVNPVGGCLPMLLQIPVWIALYNVLLSSVELYQTEFLYLLDLSSQDPYGVLPLLVSLVMVAQQSFTPTANMDPAQAQMMKLMPLVFSLFFFILPAGLVIYMFVNIVLSVAQQWYIRRTYQKPTPATSG